MSLFISFIQSLTALMSCTFYISIPIYLYICTECLLDVFLVFDLFLYLWRLNFCPLCLAIFIMNCLLVVFPCHGNPYVNKNQHGGALRNPIMKMTQHLSPQHSMLAGKPKFLTSPIYSSQKVRVKVCKVPFRLKAKVRVSQDRRKCPSRLQAKPPWPF